MLLPFLYLSLKEEIKTFYTHFDPSVPSKSAHLLSITKMRKMLLLQRKIPCNISQQKYLNRSKTVFRYFRPILTKKKYWLWNIFACIILISSELSNWVNRNRQGLPLARRYHNIEYLELFFRLNHHKLLARDSFSIIYWLKWEQRNYPLILLLIYLSIIVYLFFKL